MLYLKVKVPNLRDTAYVNIKVDTDINTVETVFDAGM